MSEQNFQDRMAEASEAVYQQILTNSVQDVEAALMQAHHNASQPQDTQGR
ncbi:hypothetical protein HYE82_08585 [Streptomyces sp. BR123]|nr:hypothetical protein [Streptomyces sp. BR123]NXY94448.1 hypothetical protein [Streptomyces sp. BR123]